MNPTAVRRHRRLPRIVALLAWSIAGAAVASCGNADTGDGVGGDDSSIGADANATDAASADAHGLDDGTSGPPGAPTVTILTPDDDSVWPLGAVVQFTASASDPNGSVKGLEYVWSSDVDGLIEEGELSDGTLVLDAGELSAGEHEITLTVTDREDLEGSDVVQLTIDSPPTGETIVRIDPEAPSTADALVATIEQEAVDAEADPIEYTFTWLVDGAPAGVGSPTVPAVKTARGETWQVSAVPSDGWFSGPPGIASVVIGNSPPTVESAQILPSAGHTDTTFECIVAGWEDADGDAESLAFTWWVNDEVVEGQTGATLDGSHFVKGDTVVCAVTPGDGLDSGPEVTADGVTILDKPPSVDQVTLTPSSGNKETEFTCTADGLADADAGDSVDLKYIWIRNGEEVPGTTSTTSISIPLERDDTLRCKVVPFSGDVEGAAVLSEEVTIGNAPPDGGAVLMGPVPATELTGITCVSNDASDPDDDNIALEYLWFVNGEPVADQTGSTLGGEHYAKGDTVLCSVIAFDGELWSEPVESKVAILVANSPPSLTGATITPAEGSSATEFTCEAQGYFDADGDVGTNTYGWLLDGEVVPGGIFQTLTPTDVGSGQLTCTVTPTDGTDDGMAVTSGPAVVLNHAPSITGALLGPEPATELTTLVCEPQGWSDDDGDTPGYTYQWSVSGSVLEGQAEAELTGADFDEGDQVVCVVTPTDGKVSGSSQPSNIVLIGNSPPAVASAAIDPPVGGKLTPFTCTPGPATDPDDGDTVVFKYAWTIGGAQVEGATASTHVPGPDAPGGTTITCQVTPNDLQADGTPVMSGPALITNQAPTIGAVVISPEAPGNDATLSCIPQNISDPDGDEVTLTYVWLINGSPVDGQEGASLPGTATEKDDEIICVITPSDGAATGDPVPSDPVIVGNAPPPTPLVVVTPVDASPGDPLLCTATSIDPDGESVTFEYFWAQDGVLVEEYTSADLPGGVTSECEEWTCFAVASDGATWSDPGEGSLFIGVDGIGTGDGLWYGHYSPEATPVAVPQFFGDPLFGEEKVGTLISPPAGVFPLTITHIRALGKSGGFHTVKIQGDLNGKPNDSDVLATATFVGTGAVSEIALGSPLVLPSQTTIWVTIAGVGFTWTAYGDADGEATTNAIYGCPDYDLLFGCQSGYSWQPYTMFGPPFTSMGDIVAAVGQAGAGGGGLTCPQ